MDNIKIPTFKCSKCGRCFINFGQDKCPFCKKVISRNIFDDIFGEDNPFDSFGRT